MDHVGHNRDHWNAQAPNWAEAGDHAWRQPDPTWGNWGAPEADLGLLPADMQGMDAIELGCGTGYVSAWMARRGARVTGIDVSEGQLNTARRLSAEHDLPITWIEGNAEATGLPEGAFDFAISEYGAAIWCDPDLWLREAWRLLRPGAALVFLGNHPLQLICTPLSGADVERHLHRPYRDFTVIDFSEVEIDPGGVVFNRTFAGWMALFARIGFVVEGYHELFAPAEAVGKRFDTSAEWARDYPSEQVWKLRKPI